MPYLSELLGKVVTDIEGERIGRLRDVIASRYPEFALPEVTALLVRSRARGDLLLPFSIVTALQGIAIPLNRRGEEIAPYPATDQDLFLARDLFDRQIIDTNDLRVVRVNDLELSRVRTHYFVANVDIGAMGLMRRLGFLRFARRAQKRREGKPTAVISWEHVELISGGKQLKLKVPKSRIADLHPADLADIISDLSRAESAKLLETLDVETVADALETVEPEFQASLIDIMGDEKAADVLEAMAPDEVADLLAELPEERSRDLLNLMEQDEAADVRTLLAYPEDTAGGIMTTEFSTVSPELTAAQAIARLRATAAEAETIYYVFVTDSQQILRGVISLRDLVLAQPEVKVKTFMQDHFISVKLGESQAEIAKVVAKYNLLAVPVVDDNGKIHGIVTADDALDKIIPTSWKKQLPRLYH